jgi:hypothetical protein
VTRYTSGRDRRPLPESDRYVELGYLIVPSAEA